MKDLKQFIKTTIREFLNEQNSNQVKNVKLSIKLIDDKYIVLAKNNDVIVGELHFIKSKFKDVLKGTSVSIHPNYRRKGIATSMYEFAENELMLKFVKNDDVLTPDGKLFWKSRT